MYNTGNNYTVHDSVLKCRSIWSILYTDISFYSFSVDYEYFYKSISVLEIDSGNNIVMNIFMGIKAFRTAKNIFNEK